MGDKAVLDWIDYTIFATSLVLSTSIGLYVSKDAKRTVSSYLFGDRQLAVIPVTLSLLTTLISSTYVLSIPTETYLYGSQFSFIGLTCFIPSLVIAYLIIPVLYDFQFISLYEYLELRFNRTIRLVASMLHSVRWMLQMPIVLYGPTLALNQVTNLNIQAILPVVCILCVIYTLGGIKSVVWVDTFQGVVIFCSIVAISVLGLERVGGVANMFQDIQNGDRLNGLDMSLDPTKRLSFWILCFGCFFLLIDLCGLNPASFQRFFSTPTMKKAQRSAISMCFCNVFFIYISTFIGFLIYSAYKDCDPFTSKRITRHDQLLPLFVMDLSKNLKGIPGLFLAGLVSAALSTMSSGLNIMAGTTYKDFIEPLFASKPSDARANLIIKSIVVVAGCICLLLVFIFDKVASILELTIMVTGTTTGVMSGIFLLGIFVPFANAKGALTGMFISTAFVAWICIGTFMAIKKNLIHYPMKERSVELCSNFTLSEPESVPTNETVFPLYKISIFHYSFIGGISVLIIGSIVSLLTGCNGDRRLDPALFSPLVRRYLPKWNIAEYQSVALEPINLNTNNHSANVQLEKKE